MLKRRQPKPAKQIDYTPRPREFVLRKPDGKDRATVPVPKLNYARDEAYRRLVAALPCAHCGKSAPSQVAHADSAGKGMALKPSDYDVMPLCAPTPGRPGCHWLIGTSGMFTKGQRRALEAGYVLKTRQTLSRVDR